MAFLYLEIAPTCFPTFSSKAHCKPAMHACGKKDAIFCVKTIDANCVIPV